MNYRIKLLRNARKEIMTPAFRFRQIDYSNRPLQQLARDNLCAHFFINTQLQLGVSPTLPRTKPFQRFLASSSVRTTRSITFPNTSQIQQKLRNTHPVKQLLVTTLQTWSYSLPF